MALSNNSLERMIVEDKYEKLVSREVFLKANKVLVDDLLRDTLVDVFHEMNRTFIENKSALEKQREEVIREIELLQEKYILNEVELEVYEKFNAKYKEEMGKMDEQISKPGLSLSNW